MSLVRTGNGITDIRGSMAGNVFARDASGLHMRPKPRRVKQRTPAQHTQRSAFAKARLYSTDHRTVSYLIYLILNNRPIIVDAIVTGDPDPDCTGKYLLAGQFANRNYYEREDSAWFIWYWQLLDLWVISVAVDVHLPPAWTRADSMEGVYTPVFFATGNSFVQLQVQPPPADYNPPGL